MHINGRTIVACLFALLSCTCALYAETPYIAVSHAIVSLHDNLSDGTQKEPENANHNSVNDNAEILNGNDDDTSADTVDTDNVSDKTIGDENSANTGENGITEDPQSNDYNDKEDYSLADNISTPDGSATVYSDGSGENDTMESGIGDAELIVTD